MSLGDSLVAFCEGLIEDAEDGLRKHVSKGEMFTPKNVGIRLKRWLCYRHTGVCDTQTLEVPQTK